MEQPILPLRDAPVLAYAAAVWFSRRWGIPAESYRESMEQCLRRKAPVPQWYVVRDGGRLLAGAGVIANAFHDRKDLTPNLCALFVEPPWRGRGTAGRLLDFIRRVDYHAPADFPVKLVFFADGELYEIAYIAAGQEALVCHALRGNKGGSRRIMLVDAPAQIAKIDCPGISGFCTVDEEGRTNYFKKAGGT